MGWSRCYTVTLMIYMVALVLCVFITYGLSQTHKDRIGFNSCVLTCPGAGEFLSNPMIRGGHYFVNTETKNIANVRQTCLVTSWSVSHFALYMIIGFICPCVFWETLLVGVVWEIVEWLLLDCHDVFDIVWNTMGFLTGAALNKVIRLGTPWDPTCVCQHSSKTETTTMATNPDNAGSSKNPDDDAATRALVVSSSAPST